MLTELSWLRCTSTTGVIPPLITALQHAITLDRPSLISIHGHGSISIYPHEGTCTTDIRDWSSVPFDQAGGMRVSHPVQGAPQGSMPLCELQWLASYHHALHTQADAPLTHGLAKLVEWPDLSGVPQEMAAPIARICALLWRKPTASTLIFRLLGTDAAQTDALLRVLQCFGHIGIVATGMASRAEDEAAAPSEHVPSQTSARASVIAKLWQRLLKA